MTTVRCGVRSHISRVTYYHRCFVTEGSVGNLLHVHRHCRKLTRDSGGLTSCLLLRPSATHRLDSRRLTGRTKIDRSDIIGFTRGLNCGNFPTLGLTLDRTLTDRPRSPSIPVRGRVHNSSPLQLINRGLVGRGATTVCTALGIGDRRGLRRYMAVLHSTQQVVLANVNTSNLITRGFT